MVLGGVGGAVVARAQRRGGLGERVGGAEGGGGDGGGGGAGRDAGEVVTASCLRRRRGMVRVVLVVRDTLVLQLLEFTLLHLVVVT